MAKENVQIVFSANTEQVRALFAEISKGADRVAQSTNQASSSLDMMGNVFGSLRRVAQAYGDVLTTNIEKQKEFNRLARERIEGGQSLAIEGGLSAADERSINASIDAIAQRRAAPNREFVRQIAEELLQVGMAPQQITGGGLESSLKILQGFNEAKPGGNGATLTRQLVANMQNLGIPLTPQNMESAAVQFNEIKQLTGLEFGPASKILEGMARIGKSPRSVKALGGLGITPEQIDPARVGIPDALRTLFDKTSGMSENQRDAMFARLFGGDEATGLARMFAKRGEIRGGDMAAFQRDAARASRGTAADARSADIALQTAQANRGQVNIETMMTELEAMDTAAGQSPARVGAQNMLRRFLNAVYGQEEGRDMLQSELIERRKERQGLNKIQIELPNKTRVPGVIKATENLEGMLKSAAGAGGGLN